MTHSLIGDLTRAGRSWRPTDVDSHADWSMVSSQWPSGHVHATVIAIEWRLVEFDVDEKAQHLVNASQPHRRIIQSCSKHHYLSLCDPLSSRLHCAFPLVCQSVCLSNVFSFNSRRKNKRFRKPVHVDAKISRVACNLGPGLKRHRNEMRSNWWKLVVMLYCT